LEIFKKMGLDRGSENFEFFDKFLKILSIFIFLLHPIYVGTLCYDLNCEEQRFKNKVRDGPFFENYENVV